ncbi:hypothetical protein BBP40_003457 [Aspergillus hancockii]|nr:hypothetical protein BBP40_003457 [Aspergillus hancockii]
MEVLQQPVLHVEARVNSNSNGIIIRTDLQIRDEVTKWLIDNFVVLSLGQEISSFGTAVLSLQDEVNIPGTDNVLEGLSEPHAQVIDTVVVTECCGGDLESGAYRLHQVELDVQAYQLRTSFEQESSQHTQLLEESVDNRDDDPKARLRGLAQKLAIRVGKHYPQTKLVEINAHSLGSKFFGESGKLVSKIFENLELLLEDEEDTFVCVMVDEIETLAARRERALGSNEPFDAVRAVNALLTGLDKLKTHTNVVVICTSNLVTALDQAFLDRVDIKQVIPYLSNRVIYGIYRECLEELSRCGIIEGSSFDVIQVNPENPQTALQYVEQATEALTLPTFDEMLLNYQMFPDAVPKQLGDAASESVGLSGRTIRRLPALSLVLYSQNVRCNIRVAVHALRTGIASETQAKTEAQ